MRIALSILLLLHGIAHLPGFLVSWRLMKAETVSYGTTIVGGALDAALLAVLSFGVWHGWFIRTAA